MADAPVIMQKIRFDGLDEAIKNLQDLAKAGQEAFNSIAESAAASAKASADVGAAFTGAVAGAADLGDAAAATVPPIDDVATAAKKAADALKGLKTPAELANIEQVGRTVYQAFYNVGGAIRNTADGLLAIGPRLVAIGQTIGTVSSAAVQMGKSFLVAGGIVAGAATAFFLFADKASNVADEISRTSESLGVTSQELQDLRGLFGSTGVNASKLTQGLTFLTRQIDQSVQKSRALAVTQRDLVRSFEQGTISSDEYIKSRDEMNRSAVASGNVFNRLGIQIAQNNDGTADLIGTMRNAANAFQGMAAGVEKTSLAAQLFGRTLGAQFLVALNEGTVGIDRLIAANERLAPAITATQLKVGEEFNNAFDQTRRTVTGLATSLGLLFAPSLTALMTAFTEMIARNRAAIEAFAASVATRLKPVIDDIIKLMSGEKLPKESFVERVRVGFVKLYDGIIAIYDFIAPIFKTILGFFDMIANGINAVFGTKFSGAALALGIALALLLVPFGLISGVISLVIAGVTAVISVFGGWAVVLTAITVAIAFFIANLYVKFGGITGMVQSVFGGIASFFSGFITLLSSGWTAITDAIYNAFSGGATWVLEIWNGVLTFFTSVFGTSIGQIFASIGTAIADKFYAVVSAIKTYFSDLVTSVINFFKPLFDVIDRIGQAVVSAFRSLAGLLAKTSKINDDAGPAAAIGIRGATGGYVRGPGTATSDSIMAWLSDKEFVMKAAAVRKYGAGFMHAINSLRFDPAAFALGGMANMSARPKFAFADGGMVQREAMRPINVRIGGESFDMTARDDVAEKLVRYANVKQIKSAGRKPAYFGNS